MLEYELGYKLFEKAFPIILTDNGTSFDYLLQTNIDLMINNINSFTRASLNWLAPIDVAKFTLDKSVIKKLNLKKVHANEIQLTPKLLKKI